MIECDPLGPGALGTVHNFQQDLGVSYRFKKRGRPRNGVIRGSSPFYQYNTGMSLLLNTRKVNGSHRRGAPAGLSMANRPSTTRSRPENHVGWWPVFRPES